MFYHLKLSNVPLDKLIKAADRGYLDHQMALAYRYQYHLNDPSKAEYYLEQATKQGSLEGLFQLMEYHYHENEPEQFLQRSEEYFNRVQSSKENKTLLYALGDWYRDKGMHEKAFVCFHHGAKLDCIKSAWYLACAYRDGVGVKQNSKKAIAWFFKAIKTKSDVTVENLKPRQIFVKYVLRLILKKDYFFEKSPLKFLGDAELYSLLAVFLINQYKYIVDEDIQYHLYRLVADCGSKPLDVWFDSPRSIQKEIEELSFDKNTHQTFALIKYAYKNKIINGNETKKLVGFINIKDDEALNDKITYLNFCIHYDDFLTAFTSKEEIKGLPVKDEAVPIASVNQYFIKAKAYVDKLSSVFKQSKAYDANKLQTMEKITQQVQAKTEAADAKAAIESAKQHFAKYDFDLAEKAIQALQPFKNGSQQEDVQRLLDQYDRYDVKLNMLMNGLQKACEDYMKTRTSEKNRSRFFFGDVFCGNYTKINAFVATLQEWLQQENRLSKVVVDNILSTISTGIQNFSGGLVSKRLSTILSGYQQTLLGLQRRYSVNDNELPSLQAQGTKMKEAMPLIPGIYPKL